MHKDKCYSTDMGNMLDRPGLIGLHAGYMVGGAVMQTLALWPFAHLMPNATLHACSPHDISCSWHSVLPVLPCFLLFSVQSPQSNRCQWAPEP